MTTLLSQAVLSRAELYMVSNVIDGSEALTIAGDVMQIMVQAWRQQNKEDDERRHKEAQSLEYKTKSHEVCSAMQSHLIIVALCGYVCTVMYCSA
jgi:hypothetical protein